MRLSATPVRELAGEVDAAVEAQATVLKDVNPLSLEVSRSVDNTDFTSLNEVVRNEEVLLVGANLEVVRSDDALVLIGIVKALDVDGGKLDTLHYVPRLGSRVVERGS